MVSWGFISLAMAFVWDTTSFYVARFLLGVAEAGFFPGIILYLTYWFPAAVRARIVGVFMVAVPVSTVIGAPLSGSILGASDGLLGLQGWQWLFITEALPSVLGGFAAFSFLTDRPDRAAWLTAREQAWLTQRMDAEHAHREAVRRFTLGQALVNPRVLALGLVYMGIVTGFYGINFWLPQIVDAFGGLSTFQVGLITAIPFLAGAAGMIVWSRHSDRTGERLWHVILPALVGALGFAGSAYLNNPISGHGGPELRRPRHLRRAADVLDLADGLADRHGCRRRHCADQLGRQSRRLCRPLCSRLDSQRHGRVPPRHAVPRRGPGDRRSHHPDRRPQPADGGNDAGLTRETHSFLIPLRLGIDWKNRGFPTILAMFVASVPSITVAQTAEEEQVVASTAPFPLRPFHPQGALCLLFRLEPLRSCLPLVPDPPSKAPLPDQD